MASNYPADYDVFVNPADTDTLDNPPHSIQHSNANDAIEAVQAELGLNPRGDFSDVRSRLDAGFRLGEVLIYTTVGVTAFVKGDYPGLQAVLVELQGGGGGSPGRAAVASGEGAASTGGGGGGFVQRLYLASALSASENVTVGDAGAAGVVGATSGGDGGDTSFKAITAAGGAGGNTDNVAHNASSGWVIIPGAHGGLPIASSAIKTIRGGHSNSVLLVDGLMYSWPEGGRSFLGSPIFMTPSEYIAPNASHQGYGSGASGGYRNSTPQAAVAGAAGKQGVAILWLFY